MVKRLCPGHEVVLSEDARAVSQYVHTPIRLIVIPGVRTPLFILEIIIEADLALLKREPERNGKLEIVMSFQVAFGVDTLRRALDDNDRVP